jgi:hypothetical protein
LVRPGHRGIRQAPLRSGNAFLQFKTGHQEAYFFLILAISSVESIHSSLKPQEAQR